VCGTVQVDDVLNSLTHEQFDEWQATDEVVPLDHTEKMLGLIVCLLGTYLGCGEGLEAIAMPWVDHDRDETGLFIASLKGGE
jgi:hypothetical protein